MIKIRVYDYGNNLYEIRDYCFKKQSKIDDYVSVGKDYVVNKTTGEAKEKRKPTSKEDVDSLQSSMLKEFRLLLYNINKAIPNGTVYYVTMTNRNLITYEDFNHNLDKFVKRLKYEHKKQSKSELKYAFIKEANAKGRYHIHGFIWYEDKNEITLSAKTIQDKWCYGSKCIKKVKTSEDLLKAIMYSTNYSDFRKNAKVTRKKVGLNFFPPNIRLVSRTRNLAELPFIVISEPPEINEDNVICHSERDQKNFSYSSTFYMQDKTYTK